MKRNKQTESIYSTENMVLSCYLFFILGFFPLYYKYQYIDMGNAKYSVFAYSSLFCIGILFLLLLLEIFLYVKQSGFLYAKENSLSKRIMQGYRKWSLPDKAVFLYFVCTTISFLASSFKEDSFIGADGWFMGYFSQLVFILLYFGISRRWKYQPVYLWILLVSSGIVFLGGILHRFDVDFLHIYGDLELEYKIQFLSTMGQSSWYSSFLCTVFPLGLYVFFTAEKKWIHIAGGVYSFLAMCSLVTQNTDSAFLSLFFVLLLLYYLSFDGEKEKQRFFEVLLLIFGSFTFVGICQRIFADRVIPLDSLSIFMTQSFLSPILFVCALGMYLLCRKKKELFFIKRSSVGNKDKKTVSFSRKPFWILVGGIGFGILAVLIFIILNSNGFFYTHFGYQNVDNYLLFNDYWGNGRGFAWRYSCELFAGLPFIQKWIGVGPDVYSFYAKSVPEYAAQMQGFWGGLVLTNAHNEYLTKLVNIGILGLSSYLFMLGSSIYVFIKNRSSYPILPAFALCVISYMAHAVFCYEQVCCSPFFYILLGIGGNLIHNKVKKSTY